MFVLTPHIKRGKMPPFLMLKLFKTRTAGAYGPLVLAPAEGVGALRAP